MKRVIVLVLAIIICLSFGACGNNKDSVYIGTYTTQKQFMDLSGMKFKAATEMTLSADGTGTFVMKATTSNDHLMYGRYKVNEGDVLLSYDLQWEESGDYLVITGSGKQYYELKNLDISAMVSEGVSVTISESYELKGNKLFNVNDTTGFADFTKTK